MTRWHRYVSFYSSCFSAFSSPCTNPDLWHFHKGRNVHQDTDTFATWAAGNSYSVKHKTVKYFLKKKKKKNFLRRRFQFLPLFSFCCSKIWIIRNFSKFWNDWIVQSTRTSILYIVYSDIVNLIFIYNLTDDEINLNLSIKSLCLSFSFLLFFQSLLVNCNVQT